jgi:hypothetical protein
MADLNDEEKLELVRRCTYLIKVYGRPGIHLRTGAAEEGLTQYQVGNLRLDAFRNDRDDRGEAKRFTPPDDKNVIKGSLRLLSDGMTVFAVPHRANVRASILKEYMWTRPDLGVPALAIIRNAMVLDDLAGL